MESKRMGYAVTFQLIHFQLTLSILFFCLFKRVRRTSCEKMKVPLFRCCNMAQLKFSRAMLTSSKVNFRANCRRCFFWPAQVQTLWQKGRLYNRHVTQTFKLREMGWIFFVKDRTVWTYSDETITYYEIISHLVRRNVRQINYMSSRRHTHTLAYLALRLPGQLSNDTSEECGGELLIGVHLYIAQEREGNIACVTTCLFRDPNTPYKDIISIVALKRTKALADELGGRLQNVQTEIRIRRTSFMGDVVI